MKKFDASIPRKMFWSDKLVNRKKCPLCHSALENEYHTYGMAVVSGRETTTLITGNDAGSFCPVCPVVVLDRKGFEQVMEDIVEAGLGDVWRLALYCYRPCRYGRRTGGQTPSSARR